MTWKEAFVKINARAKVVLGIYGGDWLLGAMITTSRAIKLLESGDIPHVVNNLRMEFGDTMPSFGTYDGDEVDFADDLESSTDPSKFSQMWCELVEDQVP